MLLQTNSYIVPKEQRVAHAILLTRFRQELARLGCTDFQVYEQVGANWDPTHASGRFVQILRFRDRAHQAAVQAAEREDATAQAMISEFCELINFPYQQDHGFFTVGFYTNIIAEESALALPPEAETDDGIWQEEIAAAIAAGRAEGTAPMMRAVDYDAEPEDASASDEPVEALEEWEDHPGAEGDEPGHASESGNGDPSTPAAEASTIGDVLDAGLANDELDVPMEAELLDEDVDLDAEPHDSPPHQAQAHGHGDKHPRG